MSKQVITIGPDGTMSSLHHKKNGLNLGDFGNIEVERVSEVKWLLEAQKWYVYLIKESKVLTLIEWEKNNKKLPIGCEIIEGYEGWVPMKTDSSSSKKWKPLLFKHYEDAVDAEVLYLNKLRKKGVF